MAGEIAAEWIKIPDGNGGFNKVWVRDSTARRSIAQLQTEIADLSAADVGAIPLAQKGAASGVAELDANGLVPSSQLPSYVDDVLEYASSSLFPATGETGKIYVDLGTNLTYRWSGSAYVEISPSLALGTTSSTAYRGDRGSAAYEHAVTNKGAAFASGLYKITTNSEGHVTGAAAVAKADITALGIPGSAPSKTSDLTNDSGFLTSAPVESVNGQTGTVNLDASDVGALPDSTTIPSKTSQLTNDSGFITSAPVTSVNTKTGAVSLTASDVGALPSGTAIPSKTSDLTNDSGFITSASLPTKTSDLTNDSGFITAAAVPSASSAAPVMDGTAAAGSSTDYARADHVHPHDTSKQDVLTSSQLAAVNSGITADDLAVNNASVLCTVTPITITPLVGSNNATAGGCYYYKIGHRVHLHIALTGLTANSAVVVCNLPTGYRPMTMFGAACLGSNMTSYTRVRVSSASQGSPGDVTVNPTSTGALIDIDYDAFS